MPTAKDLHIRLIDAPTARAFVVRHHYSKKAVNNSFMHFGVFWQGKLEGVLQFGSSLDKANMLGLVRNTTWNGFLELNRMAFSEALPRNSESRAIAFCLKQIRKHAPHVRWVVSYADATQCGDGTIYRACGFVLTAIKPNSALARLPNGSVIHELVLKANPMKKRPELGGRSFYEVTGGKYSWKKYLEAAKATVLVGYQLRYIFFLDPEARKDLVPAIIPFSEIDARGAGIYRGERVSMAERRLQAREA